MNRIRLTITGTVQGVNFRKHTIQKAQQLGNITGYVANESDGSVTVVAEGPSNKLNDLLEWCQSGPSTSQVEKVQIEKLDYSGEFEGFEVRY